jgi:FtsP/CotA-like multicopper oxidase with cupredoxin domain
MATKANSFFFQRSLLGHSITVNALYVAPQELYAVLVKIDGEAVDSYQSADPWTDAREALDDWQEAILSDAEPIVTPGNVVPLPLAVR